MNIFACSLLGAIALAQTCVCQAGRQSVVVPSFGFPVTGSSFARSIDEEYLIAAQTSSSDPGVFYRVSGDDGNQWGPPRHLFVDATSSGLEPTVIVDGEDVFLCWVERVTRGSVSRDTLYFDTSEDEAECWRGPQPMMPPPGPAPPTAVDRFVVVTRSHGSSNLVVTVALWRDTQSSRLVLYRSMDGGRSFEAPRNVSANAGVTVEDFEVVASGRAVHVAWLEKRVAGGTTTIRGVHRSLDDAAAAFGNATTVASGPLQPATSGIALDASGQDVAVGWLVPRARGDSLWWRSSRDGGSTFSPSAIRVGSYDPLRHDVDSPDLLIDGRTRSAVFAWVDDRTGLDTVWTARASLDGGVASAEHSAFGRLSDRPSIVATHDGSAAPLLLTADVDGTQRATFSQDGGASWSASFSLLERRSGEATRRVAIDVDPDYRDVALSWAVTDPSGEVRQVIGGVRAPQIATVGGAVGGAPLQFEVRGFQAGQPFVALLSGARGTTLLPIVDVSVDLEADWLLVASLQSPALGGVIAADGTGRSVPFVVPPSASGLQIWFAGVGLTSERRALVTDATSATFR